MGAMVKDWIGRWKVYHSATVGAPFGGWPEPKSSFWNPFFKALCDQNASEDAARAATDLCAESPAKNPADAFQAFRTALVASLEKRSQTGGMTREEAHAASQALSRDEKHGDRLPCSTCGGEGLAYYVRSDGEMFHVKTAGGLYRDVPELPMACPACPMGRWMAGHNKSIPDAAAYGAKVMTRLDWFVPEEEEEERDVRREVRRGLNEDWAPARAG